MSVNVSVSGTLSDFLKYKEELQEKALDACKQLAEIIKTEAEDRYAETALLDGYNEDYTFADPIPIEDGYEVVVSGDSVLFLEFGTGLGGFGHPLADELGFGPSTWSESERGYGFWDNPKGWWFKDENGERHHTMGIIPSQGMYIGRQIAEQSIEDITREVFG